MTSSLPFSLVIEAILIFYVFQEKTASDSHPSMAHKKKLLFSVFIITACVYIFVSIASTVFYSFILWTGSYPTPRFLHKDHEEKTDKVGFLNQTVESDAVSHESCNSASVKEISKIRSLMNCDVFDGNWVRDESYPLYDPGSCSLIDEQFNCFDNGRPDKGYHKLRWKPRNCTLPRLDGSHMLELLRGKRVAFVGDSLNRNMWESLVCILRNSVKESKRVYEECGRQNFRTDASFSFIFEDYNCSVEFYVSPFLVQEWEFEEWNGTKKETLRLDLMASSADRYKDADIVVFNSGHWWTHEKTSQGKDYYQEGNHVYSHLKSTDAFRKALTTWGRWVDANVDPTKTHVFFRGYSASHFGAGQWNSRGQCDRETEPFEKETSLSIYLPLTRVVEDVLKGMTSEAVTYLNVTRMTGYRKDGHPSIYRKRNMSDIEARKSLSSQDCSHWCLPGVPDAWNEILYAQLLLKLNYTR